MDKMSEALRKEILNATNSLFETTFLNTNTIKCFFYNILIFGELSSYIRELRHDYSLKTGINLEKAKPLEYKTIFDDIYTDFISYLEKKGVKLNPGFTDNLTILMYKSNPRSVEGRYYRLVKVVNHIFNTPMTGISLILNIDIEKLREKLGEECERVSDSLIEKHSWRDKILKAINHYKYSFEMNLMESSITTFWVGFLKLTNTIEILGKSEVERDVRQQIIEKLGDPISTISTGIMQYKDLYKGSPADLLSMVNNLYEILSKILATFGKILSRNSEKILEYGIIESLAPLYVLGANPDYNDAKKVELLRAKLARILIERHKVFITNQSDESLLLYEGENIWRLLLLEKNLCKSTHEVFLFLGLPVSEPEHQLDYELISKVVEY